MKARPVKLSPNGYVECPSDEATHVTIHMPGPSGVLTLPVITKGSRKHTYCWTWNGSTEEPTLRPSVLTRGYDPETKSDYVAHSWVNDGKAHFLNDSTHGFANLTADLLDLQPPRQSQGAAL